MARRSRSSILIAGAGPVGLTVAASLLRAREARDLRIEILDAGEPPRWQQGSMDLRVYALSRASQRILDDLGAWARIAERRASPYRRMDVWQDAEARHALSFDAAEIGEPDLGHIVEDSLIRSVLLDVIREVRADVGMHASRLESVAADARGVSVRLENGSRLRADLLVAADGGASTVRRLADLPVFGRDYLQAAVVAHVGTERPHGAVARQRFTGDGPLAFLPLTDGRSSIVWSLPRPLAEARMQCRDDEFLAALESASGGVLGRLGPVGERASFPLRMLHAIRYTVPGIALAGDAAHCVHPLAGQGMNLGLLDAEILATEIARAVEAGIAPGSLRTLRRYERRRKADNLETMLALDAIDRVFRLPEPLAPLGGAGLDLVDRLPAAKAALARRALGIS